MGFHWQRTMWLWWNPNNVTYRQLLSIDQVRWRTTESTWSRWGSRQLADNMAPSIRRQQLTYTLQYICNHPVTKWTIVWQCGKVSTIHIYIYNMYLSLSRSIPASEAIETVGGYIPLSLWRMASAMSDLRLPSQQSIATHWSVPNYTGWTEAHVSEQLIS